MPPSTTAKQAAARRPSVLLSGSWNDRRRLARLDIASTGSSGTIWASAEPALNCVDAAIASLAEQLRGLAALRVIAGGDTGIATVHASIGSPCDVLLVIPPDVCVVSWIMEGEAYQAGIGDRPSQERFAGKDLIHVSSAGQTSRAATKTAVDVLHIILPHILLVEQSGASISGEHSVMLDSGPPRRDPVLSGLGRLLLSAAQDSAADLLFADCIGQAVSAHVLRQYANVLTHRKTGGGGLGPARLRRVQSYIQAHLPEQLSLDQLASVAGLQQHHFCRAFKQSTGTSPHRWHLARRVERTRALIAEGRLSPAEIAVEVGFSSQAHMSTAFRQSTGQSPGEYRRRVAG